MKTLDEEGKVLIESKCCTVCKHCFYTGLPGAIGCEIINKFTDYFNTCEKWELDDKYWEMNTE